jgi:hypothetical protein
MLEAIVPAALIEGDQLIQPVDDLLLDGEGEEGILASSPDLIVDDGLVVDHTCHEIIDIKLEI